MPAYLGVELGRAVVLPQPAKDESEGVGLYRFGRMGITAAADGRVEVEDVRGAEARGRKVASFRDEGLGCLIDVGRGAVPREELSAEYRGERWPRAFRFGCASSFCSASYWRAARLVVKDLRRRLPLASRQSA